MKTLKEIIYEHIDSKWLYDNLDIDLIIKAVEEYNKQVQKNIPTETEIQEHIPYPKPIGRFQLGKNVGFIHGVRWLKEKLIGK